MHQGNLLISGWKTLIPTQSWRGRRAAGAGWRDGSGKVWRKRGKFFCNISVADTVSVHIQYICTCITTHGSFTCYGRVKLCQMSRTQRTNQSPHILYIL